jgi:dolichol-phosphate mannosyltransferase
MMDSLSVVIPTFNEKENIAILVPRVQEVLRRHGIDGEIVIVDDRSTDGSLELLEQLERDDSQVRVVLRDPPPSLARAWWEGFELASRDNIVCIDADLCHDPNYFPEMLARLETHDIVIGSRYLESRTAMMEDKSLVAVYASAVARYLTWIATGFPETDTSHSFRMFKKPVFDAVKGKLRSEGNTFLIEFLIHAKRSGFSVCEIPIVYGKRVHGQTKLSVGREGIRYLRFILSVLWARLRR